ncbi:MAG TPA: DUF1592 domain-containing protein [Candidatus Saccharimonadales bacterium]|nr:DUF1592 domain-containing protein [Candidatus Saccharimonadales bacterium]
MPPRIPLLTAFLFLVHSAVHGAGADRAGLALERRFEETVHPFLETYCFSCHNPQKQKGKLDLTPYAAPGAVTLDYRRWEVVLAKLKAGEMPPEEAKRQPPPALRRDVVDWVQTWRRHEVQRHADDPGPVLARRLSSAEYNNTIRDLTGVDLRPAREFPVDPANEAGFDNSGESLTMSPALLKKYFEAARAVADHLVLKPNGLGFAPHPVVTETDRDKYCVQRIVEFYQHQPTNLADYFETAWRFQHRVRLGQPKATLAGLAARDRISPKYLALVWGTLTTPEELGPLARLQAMWKQLMSPNAAQSVKANVRPGCEEMSAFVAGVRNRLRPAVTNLSIRGIAPGSQPFVLWKDRQFVAHRQRYVRNGRPADTKSAPPTEPGRTREVELAVMLSTNPPIRVRQEAALDRFCRVFPDAFFVSERVLVFLDEDKESTGRLLSAGFHLMTGYYRDDTPLYDLILEAPAQRELDGLWAELHFITLDAVRQYQDFIFFERAEPPRFMQGAEFDFARSEDKDAAAPGKMEQLEQAYLAKARRQGGQGESIRAIEDYFKNSSADIRWVEQARLAAEPGHLRALEGLAERAYRRPLSEAERSELTGFYRNQREGQGLSHEEALRDALVSVLMAPQFCYRVDPPGRGPVARPLSDYALASRLSYFLWASLPDDELLAHARAGDLQRRKVLLNQAHRMLQDERVRGLATEFGGNWLDFRRFEEHNSVDRDRFKAFDNELRQAMFEEPIRFCLDVMRADRSVLDFLYGNDTFVNPVLARHYGMPEPNGGSNTWGKVAGASAYGRGGLLPMAVFLTKNAPGLRTSPVKRGYWVVRRLLGEVIPPPPPNVPELPSDESKLGELTLREALARHREDPACAGCHARFDALGLVFEGFGPIGERRERDLAGKPVDAHAVFPGGSEGTGVAGLRQYLREHREQEFLDNLCRKLVTYALGRSVLLTDDPLLERMRARLQANGYRFSALVETIVTSPQFLTQRGLDD